VGLMIFAMYSLLRHNCLYCCESKWFIWPDPNISIRGKSSIFRRWIDHGAFGEACPPKLGRIGSLLHDIQKMSMEDEDDYNVLEHRQ